MRRKIILTRAMTLVSLRDLRKKLKVTLSLLIFMFRDVGKRVYFILLFSYGMITCDRTYTEIKTDKK